jgi:hypothetical protein
MVLPKGVDADAPSCVIFRARKGRIRGSFASTFRQEEIAMSARTRLILSLCAVIFVTFTQRATAQASTSASGAVDAAAMTLAPIPTAVPASPGSQIGPTMQSASVALQHQSSALTETAAASALAAQRRNAGLGQAQAMMIVGGAAILVGAIVGDSPGQIIMIGGAVVGLVGL